MAFSKADYNRLIDVLMVQTNSENEKLMVLYLDKTLRSMKLEYAIDSAGNVLVIKGKADLYPCVVSHMDTVHKFVNGFNIRSQPINYVLKDGTVTRTDIELRAFDNKGKRVGIGGDDKCGVYACLHYLKYMPTIKVVFFSREEVGCRGSGSVNHDFFKDCMYIIQLDRRGNNDFITNYWSNQTASHKFMSDIGTVKKKYGFSKGTGTVTDSVKLWHNGVGISCCNISCGYYDAHSSTEYISLPELENSVNFIKEAIETLPLKQYKHKKPKEVKFVYTKTRYATKQCTSCLTWKSELSLYMREGKLYCYECHVKNQKKKNGILSDKTIQPDNDINNDTNNDTKNLAERLTYECHSCRVSIGAGAGKIFRLLNGHLYCNECVVKYNLDFEGEDRECSECGCAITSKDFDATVGDKLLCTYCFAETPPGDVDRDIDNDTPSPDDRVCWMCGETIPGEQEIILRFEEEVCIGCDNSVVNPRM